MPPLTNPENVPVGAVYGFTNMLLKLLKEHKPDYFCVAFDSGKETFRSTIYPAYKANRPDAPDDLKPQFPLVRDAASALGLKSFEMVGYEADDIIATFTKRALEQGIEVTIVSSDKDLMQLVDDGKVTMFDAMKNKFIKEKDVLEKFGVQPAKVLDVCSLIGDSSDNVPGAPSIGPKTAAELIAQFDNLDNLLAKTAEIKQPKRREVLEANKAQILMSRELIRLHFDVPLEVDFASLDSHLSDEACLLEFCKKHNFKSLVAKFSNVAFNDHEHNAPAQKPANFERVIIKTATELKTWLADVDTKLAIYFIEDAAISLAKNGSSAIIKFTSKSNDLFTPAEGLTKEEILATLKPALDDDSVLKIYHNIKSQHPTPSTNHQSFDDIQIMEYVARTGITDGELEHIAPDITPLKNLLGSGKNKRKLEETPAEELLEHGASVAEFLFTNHARVKQELFSQKLLTVYEKIEKPLIGVLAKMEARGAKIDPAILNKMSEEFATRIAALEVEIHQMAGSEFNVASPSQIGEVLFEKMGIAGGKKSKKTGHYSTGADVLEELSLQGHVIAEKILQHRQLSKLKSTYTDALPNSINPATKSIHTTYMMTAANTGRLSSQNPNLQNIPIRTEEGKKIRTAFVAESGNKLISADYSQIELRLLAHVANIEPLKEAFKNGQDVHNITAHQVFGVPLDKVDSNYRRMAKTINFGIIYGLSAHGLAERLGISRQEAASYIEQYFRQYAGIKQYMSETIEFCKAHGYVQTIFGRKCYIKGINDKIPAIRQFSERAAINAPLQGAAADIIKRAMISLDRENLPMTLQVHDELIFEVPEGQAEALRGKIINIMQNAAHLSVPLVVEAQIGDNWGAAH